MKNKIQTLLAIGFIIFLAYMVAQQEGFKPFGCDEICEYTKKMREVDDRIQIYLKNIEKKKKDIQILEDEKEVQKAEFEEAENNLGIANGKLEIIREEKDRLVEIASKYNIKRNQATEPEPLHQAGITGVETYNNDTGEWETLQECKNDIDCDATFGMESIK